MGQTGSRRADVMRALRENDTSLTAVELDGMRLTEKDVRKLSEALRQNRYSHCGKGGGSHVALQCGADVEHGYV